MKWQYLLCLILTLNCRPSFANSASDWLQIKQPLFTLIFHPEIEAEAQRTADKLNDYLKSHLLEMPLEKKLKPIPIVLYNESQTSNGNVGLIPYRSQWYNRPSSFSGLEWFDVLAVHESRHIVQFNQIFDTRAGKILGVAFGAKATAGMSALLVPSWFIEGDAVVSETTLTRGGRGRVASFDLWFRTDTLEHPAYSYERAMLGTGFDRVPYLSPYVLGYFLTTYLRTEYGSDVFDRSIDHLATSSGFNFDGSIKTETNSSLSTHYQNMINKLRQKWQQQLPLLSDVTTLTDQPNNRWNSLYPIAINAEGIAAVEVDIEQGNFLVEIVAGEVSRLTKIPKSVSRNYYSGSKTKAVFRAGNQYCWVAEIEHIIKPFKQSGDLFCWTENGLEQKTKRMNLTSASYQDGYFIAHQFTNDRTSKLLIINKSGDVQKQLILPAHSLAFDFMPTEGGWVYVLIDGLNDGIYFVDQNLSGFSLLAKADSENIRSPVKTKNWLLFTSDRTGIDQVMAQSLSSDRQFQVAARPYGSYFLNWDAGNQQVVFADYSASGQKLSGITFEDNMAPIRDWIPAEQLPANNVYAKPLFQTVDLPQRHKPYAVKNYSVVSHLWNPHSWRLLYDGTVFSAVINSNDILDKLLMDVGVDYYKDNNEWVANVSAQYRTNAGPYLSLGLQKNIQDNYQIFQSWQTKLFQPITVQHGAVTTQWLPGIGGGWQTQVGYPDRQFLSAELGFVVNKDKAFQAIEKPYSFGQSLYGRYQWEDEAVSLLSTSRIDLPGFSSKQALNIRIEAQQKPEFGSSLLESNSLFAAPVIDGLTVQTSADYRVNFGGVGLPITPLSYWRNTNLILNFRNQQSPALVESAVGLTLQPSFNLFRNNELIADPKASVYYLPLQDTWQAKLGFVIYGL